MIINPVRIVIARHQLGEAVAALQVRLANLTEGSLRYRQVEEAFFAMLDAKDAYDRERDERIAYLEEMKTKEQLK